MNPEEQKIQRILDLLEEQRVVIERMRHIGTELEKVLRVRLNDKFEVVDPHGD